MKILSIPMFVLLAGCGGSVPVETSDETTVCLGQDQRSDVRIGIGDATVEAAYSRHRVVARPEALTEAMVGGVRSALRKSIALAGGDTWWGHESALYDGPTTRSLTNV